MNKFKGFSKKKANLNFLVCSISTIEDDAFDDLHSLQWLKLWNNNLQTLHYELMEPVLDTLIHLDIHSEPFFHLTIFITCSYAEHGHWQRSALLHYRAISPSKFFQIFEQLVQAIHWCATARCGGTRDGTTTAGRWFVAQLDNHPENRAVNVLAGRYKYY